MIRIALIGAGGIARQAHLPSLTEFKDIELAAVCDVQKDIAEKAKNDYSIPRSFIDFRNMLDSVELNAVYIAVQPHFLLEIALECFKRKLHVFLEKPPGVNKEETAKMAAAAAKNKCLTMVGFHRRFTPLTVKARALVEARGPIDQCMVTYVKNLVGQPPYYEGKASMLTLDVIHAVDNLRWMGGEVKNVRASTRRLHADYDNSFNAFLEFENGAVGFLNNSFAAGKRIFSIEMHAKGVSAFIEPEEKACVYADNNPEGTTITSADAAASADFHRRAGFSAESRHFIDCVKSAAMPATNLEDALKTMELLGRIQAASG